MARELHEMLAELLLDVAQEWTKYAQLEDGTQVKVTWHRDHELEWMEVHHADQGGDLIGRFKPSVTVELFELPEIGPEDDGALRAELAETPDHPFEASPESSGMACTRMVLRDGYGDACGLPADQHPKECLNCAPFIAQASSTRVDGSEPRDACRDCGAVLAPRPFDPDNPGCAPETCGGSRLDPCEAIMRTEGMAHDDDPLAGPLDRQWEELAPGDRAQGGDGQWYRVMSVRDGEDHVAITLEIGSLYKSYPMPHHGPVKVKRGPEGVAYERMKAAGLEPRVLP